ncbi:CoA-binding protein [Peribacillus sp. SCS-26]|uniref:CoA-binding protein n=1 Tax=Paraperibacillus marinus TaxID=3115295 RepID=UPI00390610C5
MSMENPSREEIRNILKKAKRIAVIGLSENPNKTSYMVSEAMQNAGYEIIPVNPEAKSPILGVHPVRSLSEIDGHIDIVNVFRRSEFLLDAAKEFAEANADVFWAQLGLYNEEAYQFLKEKGAVVIMDRCIKVEHAMTR